MHHYFDAITNNKGDALTGYYVRLVDSGGAGVTLYADTSLTPIVSVSGVADAAKVDGDGNVDFYVAVGTYRLDIYATDSTTLVKSILDVGMNIDADTAATALAAQAAASSSATAAASSASAASSSATAAASSATTAGGSAAIALSAVSGIDVSTAVVPVINRTALSTLATGIPAYLKEAGREGMFVWSSSNLSTLVTADTAQGIYVAPSSDTTGASGAWVRKPSGLRLLTTFWGLSTANTAAQNGAAMDACMATLRALKTTGYAYAYGSVGVHTPAGIYPMDRQIAPQCACEFTGDSGMMGGGTVFTFNADVKGLYLQGWDGSDRHASGYKVRGIHLKGNGSTGGGNAGIEANAIGVVSDCFIEGFSGDGIYAWGATGTPAGNANGAVFQNIYIQSCRNGTYTDNSDGNAISFINVSVSSCRLSGHYDSSFLGCFYAYGTIQTLGTISGFLTRCHQGGFIYAVRQGQEVWCSTNAPPATATNNQGWQYFKTGTAQTYQPTWTTGQTWNFSAAFCNDNDNQASTFHSIYIEQDCNPCWLRGSGMVLSGFISVPVYDIASGLPYGGHFNGGAAATRFFRNINADGGMQISGTAGGSTQNCYFGPQANPGFATDYEIQLHNWNASSILNFYSQGVKKGQVGNTSGQNYYDAGAHNFRPAAGGTPWAIASINGLAVQIGTIGYATGAGGAVTQATSKSTGVTLSKGSGQITLNAAALAASTSVSFTLTNTLIAATDTVVVSIGSGATAASYTVGADQVSAGSCRIHLRNVSGGSLSEALVLNFALIKAVAA